MPCFSIIWILVTLAHKKKASCKYTPNRGWKTIFSYWESNFLGAMLYFPNYNISPDQISLKFSGISRNLKLPHLGPKTRGIFGKFAPAQHLRAPAPCSNRHHFGHQWWRSSPQPRSRKGESTQSTPGNSHEPRKKKTFLLSIRLVVW